MQQNVHCISLRTVRYNDSQAIVTVWSRECGRLSLSVPWGATREGQRRRAVMMPLSLFEGVANLRPGRDVATISDVRACSGGNASAFDPVTNVVAVFIADFLNAVLRESQPDELLTDFIFSNVRLLGSLDNASLANYHLYFLYHLGQMLGIAPDMGTYAPARYLDLREGIYTVSMPLHRMWLAPDEARVAWLLSRLSPRTLSLLRLSRDQRRRALDVLLQYYDLHLAPVSHLPSLQVLHSIFQ